MSTYLSKERTWSEPTPELVARDGKGVLVVKDDRRMPMHVRVWIEGGGSHAGKCSVAVWQTTGMGQSMQWTPGGTPPLVTRVGSVEAFLTEAGLAVLKPDEEYD